MINRRTFLKVSGLLFFFGPQFLASGQAVSKGKLFRPVLVIDQRRCLGCRACVIVCKEAKGAGELFPLTLELKEKGTYPGVRPYFEHLVCRQCQRPLCIAACPSRALRQDQGVVRVDTDRCQGLGSCLKVCPYPGGIGLDPLDQKAKKCDFCLEILNKGGLPRCVEICPSGARIFGDLMNPTGPLAVLVAQRSLREILNRTLQIEIPRGSSSPKRTPWPRRLCSSLPLGGGRRLVHTVCLACNARCGLRIWTKGEEIIRVEGNPYHPYNRRGQPIPYETPVTESLKETASTCAKPQCDRDYLENPYRVLQPLKRHGPRGSGHFVPISWEKLIREIAEGGKLFAHLGDNRQYPGLREILSDDPIDPAAPELGPRRNQLLWLTGRSQAGRKHFIKRFVSQAVGSKNYIGHTDICGLGFRMGNWALTGGQQVELKADLWDCRYMLIFGANIYAALQPGLNTAGAILADRAAAGELKFVIIDPRAHEAVAQAYDWLPVRPGKDGALALGILRVLLEEGLYDQDFLSLATSEGAREIGRNVFSNATHLVVSDPEHPRWGHLLRVADLGISGPLEDPVAISPDGSHFLPASKLKRGLLDWQGKIELKDGSRPLVKTAFRLLKESVLAHDLSFYAREAGIPEDKIRQTARDFAAHAPKSAAFAYHGGGNYLGGTYASYAIALLNVMVGNINLKGGYLPPGGGAGNWQKGIYNLKSFPGARRPQGIKISREKAAYEKTTEYRQKGYPSKLPWFPFTKGGLSVSALCGVDQGYPYPIKILFTYFFNPIYSVPGGERFRETFASVEKIPLHVSIDITINETNIYADYIVPDVTYLEGHYGFLTPHAPAQRFTAVRTPVVSPRTGRTKDGRPYSLETFLIDLAEHLGLAGFGKGAIMDARGGLYDLHRAEDYYLRGLANLAYSTGLPPADPEEQAYVEANYPVAAYRQILSPEEWARCCRILARGGVFWPPESAFDPQGNLKGGLPQVFIWNEDLATSRHSLTGDRFWGTVRYERPRDARGRLIDEDPEYPFVLITHKMALHTQSRTICYRDALLLESEPPVLLNPKDASSLGLKDGETIKIISRSHPRGLKGRLRLSHRVRPGCLVIPHHYGHWQHGASELFVPGGQRVFLGGERVVKGNRLLADPTRAQGLSPNLLSLLDEGLMSLPLVDVLGGIPDFSSTRVKVVRGGQ
ncbi:4Fe-4S dicluster domain-containing protein [Thermosulfuriphilus sp.]